MHKAHEPAEKKAAMKDDTQATVMAALSDPCAHGLSADAVVERIDTHAAALFLAGDHAYKLKKNVTFPFLDYGSLSKRLAACQAEVRLNRRTAPGLYLGVGGLVHGPDGTPRLMQAAPLAEDGGPAPDVMDYVVTMARFPQEALLDRMAAAGRLDGAIMSDLADTIATFHEAAEVRRDAPGATEMAALVAMNADQMRQHTLFPEPEVAHLDLMARTALAAQADLIDRRRDAGYIRHCHGDLHLRNIVMLEGKPTPFDCIEFGDRIAVTDVLYDLAFLLMDLEHRGMRDLANILFNRYLDQTGDLAGLSLLPLFMSVRAGIRAHLTASAIAGQADPGRVGAMRREALAYLALAARLLRPPPARLVAIGGLSGTGKTTLACHLAPELGPAPGAVILRSDVLRKKLLGVDPQSALPEKFYAEEYSIRTYGEMAGRAGLILEGGHGVICDGVYARPAQRQAVEMVARMAGTPFAGLWLVADQKLQIERVGRRRGDASDADAAIVRRQAAYDIGDMRWDIISAGGDPQETAAIARRHVTGAGH